MTIAACYLSTEGVVFGADSTSTIQLDAPGSDKPIEHHLNFGQKIFEVGEDSTLAITNWGLAALPSLSYRTMIARFGDDLSRNPANSVDDAAWRWNTYFWSEYAPAFAQLKLALASRKEKVTTPEENDAYLELRHTGFCGFCIGGYLGPSREPKAFEISFHPDDDLPNSPQALRPGYARFWGWPNLIERLVWGVDDSVYGAVLKTGKWSGTEKELADALLSNRLVQPADLPLREAIDWVHASIYTTIKAMKFSHWAPYCGGPIEIAVVSTDRKFRWVKHKTFSAALEI